MSILPTIKQSLLQRWDVEAEIKVSPTEKSQLSKTLSLKPGDK